jgi:hypothetical protein
MPFISQLGKLNYLYVCLVSLALEQHYHIQDQELNAILLYQRY